MCKHECYEFRFGVNGVDSAGCRTLLAFCDVLISVWNNSSGLWEILTHTRVNLQTGRPVCPDRMSFTLEGHEKHYVKLACGGLETHPQQRHLQKERPVCISIEGHGDHYVKRFMQWCRGWVRTGPSASLSRSKLWRRAAVECCIADRWFSHGVPMSPGYGG
ncbi:hypothetical protein DAPPUDRAFT_97789 [Daphnia pulex]|uniref:Uncharacterized protein n=1 Tax=Daphnia pulex TaxID=6669 RepID=E9G1A7_DAPPU|nr:hypothetical protein DAPPUDRAFT_97788 [Daphnia pulex]EFX86672.1 hypothetical protein DAPPUDRAFT_97789 [Daphnia pulex]|eukprot:EFX86637.1 hypothetical protein DAPPUDRAFT_97788 [Daphnia pulex]